MKTFWNYQCKNNSILKLYIDNTITDISGCILWTGYKEKAGYGNIYYHGKVHKAHRLAYELFKKSIPNNLEIDHICRNKICVNPLHLRAVSHSTNMFNSKQSDLKLTKTHCKFGHDLNISGYYDKHSKFRCSGCNKRNNEKRKQKK